MTKSRVIPLFAGEADLDAAWAVLDRLLRNGSDTTEAQAAYARVLARQTPAQRARVG